MSKRLELPSATLPPAQPNYILRGHAAAVNSLLFLRHNTRLLSGDADGYVVLWTLTTKRPAAVWKAHEGGILGLGTWGDGRIVTHGRDSRLRVWSLSDKDEVDAGLSTALPVEQSTEPRKQPWLLHSLSVSSLNFCSFASCTSRSYSSFSKDNLAIQTPTDGAKQTALLIAVPGEKDSHIEIYLLPAEKQVALITAPDQAKGKSGMVMALALFYKGDGDTLHVVAGYESGRTCVFRQVREAARWQEIYSSTPHSQPVLSLDIAPSLGAFFTSSADAIIAKHPMFALDAAQGPIKEVQTRHSGQQGLAVREDGRILATAGWDARTRVYSAKTMKELAVLKWHKEGCYSIAFACVNLEETVPQDESGQALMTHGRSQTVAEKRESLVKETHWLVAGSKDGKISLWDIY